LKAVNSERAIFCCIQNIALLAKWALRALIKTGHYFSRKGLFRSWKYIGIDLLEVF
jgi:hypothetical protein